MKVELYTKVDPEKDWKWSAPKKTDRGTTNVYVKDQNTGESPYVQLCTTQEPRLKLPFGLSKFDENNPGRHNCSISIPDGKLTKFAKDLDDWVMSEAKKNETAWFGKGGLGKRVFCPILKKPPEDEGKSYNPLFHAKTSEEELSVQILDSQSDPPTQSEGKWSDVKKQSRVIPIARVVGIWLAPRMYGLTVVIQYLMVEKDDALSATPFIWESSTPKPVLLQSSNVTTDAANKPIDKGETESDLSKSVVFSDNSDNPPQKKQRVAK
jgi:hypothetical protein